MSPDNRHKFALPYWARPSIRTMAAPADGGGDDDTDADTDDEDDDEDEDEDEAKTPEELRAELKSVRDSIAKANGSSANRRATIKRLKAELAAKGAPAPKTDDAGTPDTETLVREAEERGRKSSLKDVIGAKAEAALSSAQGINAKRLVRMLDIDELDLNKDGTVDGLDDAIDELKTEYPELFGTPAPKRRRSVAGENDRGAGDKGPSTKLTATERQAQSLVPGARLSKR